MAELNDKPPEQQTGKPPSELEKNSQVSKGEMEKLIPSQAQQIDDNRKLERLGLLPKQTGDKLEQKTPEERAQEVIAQTFVKTSTMDDKPRAYATADEYDKELKKAHQIFEDPKSDEATKKNVQDFAKIIIEAYPAGIVPDDASSGNRQPAVSRRAFGLPEPEAQQGGQEVRATGDIPQRDTQEKPTPPPQRSLLDRLLHPFSDMTKTAEELKKPIGHDN